MDCFADLFSDEFCERTEFGINLFSLFAGIFSAEARGCQGGLNRIGWRSESIWARSGMIFGRFWREGLRSAATRRHTLVTGVVMQTENMEKRGCFMVKIKNKCRVFQCSVNWARARHRTTFIAVGAAASSSICSRSSVLLPAFTGGGLRSGGRGDVDLSGGLRGRLHYHCRASRAVAHGV